MINILKRWAGQYFSEEEVHQSCQQAEPDGGEAGAVAAAASPRLWGRQARQAAQTAAPQERARGQEEVTPLALPRGPAKTVVII